MRAAIGVAGKRSVVRHYKRHTTRHGQQGYCQRDKSDQNGPTDAHAQLYDYVPNIPWSSDGIVSWIPSKRVRRARIFWPIPGLCGAVGRDRSVYFTSSRARACTSGTKGITPGGHGGIGRNLGDYATGFDREAQRAPLKLSERPATLRRW